MFTLEKIKWGLLLLSLCFLLLLVPFVQSFFFNPLSFECSKNIDAVSVILCLTCVVTPYLIDKVSFFRLNIIDKSEKIHAFSLSLFSIIVFVYLFSQSFGGDDVVFQLFLNDKYIPQFLIERYYTCSSRLIIETFLEGMVNTNHLFWTVFTTIVIVSLFEAIVCIAMPSSLRKFSGIVYALFFLIPTSVLSDAGWAATTLNYIWSLAASMPTFLIMKRIIKNDLISLFDRSYAFLLLLYAANSELMALVILASYFLLIVYKWKESGVNVGLFKIPGYCWIVILVCIAYLAFALTAPGSAYRVQFESAGHFPEFLNFGMVEKLGLAFLSTFPYLYCSGVSYPLNFCMVFLISLFCLYFYKIGNKKMLMFQFPTIVLFIFFEFLPVGLVKHGIIPYKTLLLFSNFVLPEFSTYSSVLISIELFVYMILFISLLCSIYSCFQTKEKSIVACLIFLAGFCSHLTMGFTPTVYASGYRPFLLLTVSIIVVGSFVIVEILSLKDKVNLKYLFTYIIVFFGVIYLIGTLVRVNYAYAAEMLYPKEIKNIQNNNIQNTIDCDGQIPDLPIRKHNNQNLNCGIVFDCVNGEIGVPKDRFLEYSETGLCFTGWAIDLDNLRPLSALYIKIGDKVFKTNYGIARTDVKDAFHLQFDNLGFTVDLPYEILQGQSSIEFTMIGEHNDFKYEPVIYDLTEK